MAYSIAKAVMRNTSHHNKAGGRAKGNMAISKISGRGNKGSFGNRKNSKIIKSINTGGNYGVIG